MKYTDYQITFREFPDEISLCINISNCPCHCEGCHSSYLSQDIGKELTHSELDMIIRDNHGIDMIGIMGGDATPEDVLEVAQYLRSKSIRVGWYSGRAKLPDCINLHNLKYFDYIKLGPYIAERGGLDKESTNQRMYQIITESDEYKSMKDITYKFWTINKFN